MKPEQAFRAQVVQRLKPLHPFPVENCVAVGMPDINFSLGWIELKVDKWVGGRMKLTHFTGQQRAWLFTRRMSGGNAWLFVLVEGEYFLFDGSDAFSVAGLTKEECYQKCVAWYDGKLPDMKELCLTFQTLARRNDVAHSKSRGIPEVPRDDVPNRALVADSNRPHGEGGGGVEDVRPTAVRQRVASHLDFGGSSRPD
jgi:hypothetical protein